MSDQGHSLPTCLSLTVQVNRFQGMCFLRGAAKGIPFRMHRVSCYGHGQQISMFQGGCGIAREWYCDTGHAKGQNGHQSADWATIPRN